MTMYPRNIFGTNNTITRATVGRSGSAGIVTSQLSNEVSFSHVFGAGLIGLDDAAQPAFSARAVREVKPDVALMEGLLSQIQNMTQ